MTEPLKVEAVNCPKCKDGKMVPLSKAVNVQKPHIGMGLGNMEIAPLYEWKCVRCGYSIKATE